MTTTGERLARPSSSRRTRRASEPTPAIVVRPPRATLTWDEQPDVDLHAFEPDGTQVFYRNLRGPTGFLDVDDVTGFGPENYFVACDTVATGTYQIGVNYFSGSAPTTATVSLFLGDGRTPAPRTVVLNTPRGSSGNSSPQIIFTINVGVEDGQVRYTVN